MIPFCHNLNKQEHEMATTVTINRGAGIILKSSQAYMGYKFSPAILIDSDDRYLFDLEVFLSCIFLIITEKNLNKLKHV